MTYAVEFTRSAQRQLDKLPKRLKEHLNGAITELESEPRPHGVDKIRGATDQYRIRVGDYRVVFEIDDDARVVSVIAIGHRSVVYRHLSLILLVLG